MCALLKSKLLFGVFFCSLACFCLIQTKKCLKQKCVWSGTNTYACEMSFKERKTLKPLSKKMYIVLKLEGSRSLIIISVLLLNGFWSRSSTILSCMCVFFLLIISYWYSSLLALTPACGCTKNELRGEMKCTIADLLDGKWFRIFRFWAYFFFSSFHSGVRVSWPNAAFSDSRQQCLQCQTGRIGNIEWVCVFFFLQRTTRCMKNCIGFFSFS